MDTGPAQRQLCGPGGHVPHKHRILLEEILWRPPKCDSLVPATLVPDGDTPRTQESYPSALEGLGVHYDRFKLHSPLGATPWMATARRREAGEHAHHARAERAGRDWAGLGTT